MKHLALLAVLALSACGAHPATDPTIVTQIVNVPTPVPCDPKLPPEPVYPDTPEALAAAPNVFEVAKLVKAGLLLRTDRLRQVEAALEACATLPPAKP